MLAHFFDINQLYLYAKGILDNLLVQRLIFFSKLNNLLIFRIKFMKVQIKTITLVSLLLITIGSVVAIAYTDNCTYCNEEHAKAIRCGICGSYDVYHYHYDNCDKDKYSALCRVCGYVWDGAIERSSY